MHQKDYIKIRVKAPGVQAKELDTNFAIIGTADSGGGGGDGGMQVRHA